MTTTTLPTITHRITYDRDTRDYACYVQVEGDPEQYIGSAASYHAGELKCVAHKRDLLESDIFTPATTLDGQCGDCGAALDSMGLCGCGAEEPAGEPKRRACPNCGGTDIDWTFNPPRCLFCDPDYDIDELRKRYGGPAPDAPADHTRPAPLACICGQPAPILEPHGAFCGACHEASDLWRLWKEDSTEFVAELRRQSCRLNEMAARLCVWLNAKNKSSLGTDSILAMWRQLLGDDEPPKPRFYVVAARQQVAA